MYYTAKLYVEKLYKQHEKTRRFLRKKGEEIRCKGHYLQPPSTSRKEEAGKSAQSCVYIRMYILNCVERVVSITVKWGVWCKIGPLSKPVSRTPGWREKSEVSVSEEKASLNM